MQVCLYSHAFWPSIGGIETVSALLAEYLLQGENEVTVVTQSPGPPANGGGYRLVRCPKKKELRRIVGEHELLHANGMSVRAVLAAARCGVPVVVTHQTFNAALPKNLGELRRMVEIEGTHRLAHAAASAAGMHLADVNACISRFVLERLRPPRALVLYNPIGRIFRPLPEIVQRDHFAFVGRLVGDKGCDVLIRALAECARQGRRYQVKVYGDGPEREKLLAQARDCDVAEHVRFCGSVQGEDLVRAYNRSLAVVVPSTWQEPLGVVALEAMACGRAVIASAGGGLGEIVSGVGVTFPNGDFEALADGLIRLAENPGLRQEAERKGVQLARKCSIDVTGEMYLSLYQSVLERKGKRPREALEPGAA